MPVYEPMPEYKPMSPSLLPLEPFVPELLMIKISSSNSPTPASEPHLASDSIESDPSEESSTIANRVFGLVFKRGGAFGSHWIHTLIIPHERGHRGRDF